MDSPARGAEALAQDPAGHRRQEAETFAPELSCLVPSIDLSISQPDVQGLLPPAPCMGGGHRAVGGSLGRGERRQQSRDPGVLGPAVAVSVRLPWGPLDGGAAVRVTAPRSARQRPGPQLRPVCGVRAPGAQALGAEPRHLLYLPLCDPTAGGLYLPACPEESA